MALVAESVDGVAGSREILGVGRLSRQRNPQQGEVAVLVADAAQRLGLGTELLRRLIEIGRDEKFTSIIAHTLPDNAAMRGLAKRFGFIVKQNTDPGEITAILSL